ncbi:MAG: prepilin-type N-terminal cleavage/methylation domain-containing protein [Christensenellales bacterium]|jgi:type IV pilus assembly protein PilA
MLKNKKGFTLIEILIIILIIGILAALTVPILSNVFKNRKIGTAIGKAENIYHTAATVNRNIDNGREIITAQYTTRHALNKMLDEASQIGESNVITSAQFAAKTAEGNYISVNGNNLITDVYVIYGGAKVHYNSTGVVSKSVID